MFFARPIEHGRRKLLEKLSNRKANFHIDMFVTETQECIH